MDVPEWREVHDTAQFEARLSVAAKDPENSEFRLAALGRLALEEWELGRVEQVLQRLAPPSVDKCALLTRLAERFRLLGDLGRAREVLERGHEVATGIARPWQRGKVLCGLAEAWTRVGDSKRARDVWEEAITLAMKPEESADQEGLDASSVLGEIVEGMAVGGFGPRALEVAGRIPHAAKQERARQRVGAIIALRVAPRPKA